MRRQYLHQLIIALLAGGFLNSTCHAQNTGYKPVLQAQNQVANNSPAIGQRDYVVSYVDSNSHALYATNQHLVNWNGYGYGCPCPQCTAGAYGYGMPDLVHGLQTTPLVQWLIDDNYYVRSPDHGFVRITKRPVERNPVVYTKYWPTHWYGAPRTGPAQRIRRYPTVALPTDTTQLGYYYQQVPSWQPNSGMIPPPPQPKLFHLREKCRACIDNGCRVICAPSNSSNVGGVNQPVNRENVPPPAPSAEERVPPAPDPQQQNLNKTAENTRIQAVSQ